MTIKQFVVFVNSDICCVVIDIPYNSYCNVVCRFIRAVEDWTVQELSS